jgi:hypothetical protein
MHYYAGCGQRFEFNMSVLNGTVQVSGGEIKLKTEAFWAYPTCQLTQYTPYAGQRYVWDHCSDFYQDHNYHLSSINWLGLINWKSGHIYEQNSVPSTPTPKK